MPRFELAISATKNCVRLPGSLDPQTTSSKSSPFPTLGVAPKLSRFHAAAKYFPIMSRRSPILWQSYGTVASTLSGNLRPAR